jgi:hypothetical protein
MKLILILTICICSVQVALGQCNTFFPLQTDKKLQYEYYDKKDKPTLRSNQWFKSVSGSGNSMKGIMVQELVDVKKDEVLTTSESEWICDNGTLHFAINSMSFGPDQQAAMGPTATMDVTGDKMDLPSDLKVGQTFKDLNYQMKMTVSGIPMMNRTYEVKDRKVEAEESVTTPAGTFPCYKLSYNTTSKGSTLKTIIWYAKNTGMVKMESYNEKGTMVAKQLLTKIGG